MNYTINNSPFSIFNFQLIKGNNVAGNARKETEKELGRSVISDKNFLDSDGKLRIKNENN